MSSLSSKYARFDALYDSDDEKQQKEKDANAKKAELQRAKADEARKQMSTANGKSGPAGPKTMMNSMDSLDMNNMTPKQRDELLETYANVFNKNRPSKAKYKFPETIEEQRAKCEEADALRVKGNHLFKSGQILEAAKLYEQAVLKFADW